jgi:rare lipoprotein A
VIGRRANTHFVAVLCACAAALVAPALALAGSGGGGLSAPPGSQSSADGNTGAAGNSGATGNSGTTGTTQPGNVSVTSTAGGMSIVTRSSAFLANGLKFSGTAPSRDAGKTVVIERSGHQTGWTWTPTVQAQVASNGSFSAVWNTNHIGRFSIRAVLSSGQPSGATTSADSSDWPTVTVIVYRPSVASWYGDKSQWGSTTACGQVLHKNTLGVANKTLPCGTQVAFYYEGRTITVPVIDRGPYVRGRDWDLTRAAATLLKVDGVATVGAVSLPRQPS